MPACLNFHGEISPLGRRRYQQLKTSDLSYIARLSDQGLGNKGSDLYTSLQYLFAVYFTFQCHHYCETQIYLSLYIQCHSHCLFSFSFSFSFIHSFIHSFTWLYAHSFIHSFCLISSRKSYFINWISFPNTQHCWHFGDEGHYFVVYFVRIVSVISIARVPCQRTITRYRCLTEEIIPYSECLGSTVSGCIVYFLRIIG